MNRLKSKVALVTGGASGLGKAIAQRLAAEGASVAIGDIQTVAGEAVAAEHGWVFLEQDVTDEERWPQVIGTIERRLGPLDILVNNAGIIGPMNAAGPEDSRFTDWKRIFAANVESVFLGCRAAIPALRRTGGGSIINISSIAGLRASPYAVAYGASKAAVRQLTQSVAQYCAEHKLNIRCNSVHPGDVRTAMWEKAMQQIARKKNTSVAAVVESAAAMVPLGELMSPEDIAAAVAFLVSDDGRHITGEKLVIDGGVVNCNTFRVSTSNEEFPR
jgi:3(or 17)beta-hydroxysteroid dehydrogenase